jgi:hypothetical protein
MKTSVWISSILVVRIATVFCLMVLAHVAQAAPVAQDNPGVPNEFQVEGAPTSEALLAKFFPACDPLQDSRCPVAPPRCGSEGFSPTQPGFEVGAYRSCAALGGKSPSGVSSDVALGCACSATCEQSGKQVAGRWICNECLAVCE